MNKKYKRKNTTQHNSNKMKSLVILAVGCLAVAASGSIEDSRIHAKNNFFIENAPVYFYLYTNSNPIEGEIINATSESIRASKFNTSFPTRFIISGFLKDYLSKEIQNIRDALLNSGEYNIVVVDWPQEVSRMNFNPALPVPKVGKKVANLINHLKKHHKLKLNNCLVIGYELGAHVAGYAGKNILNGKIGTIIGLSPPHISFEDPMKRLNSTDALYVETIQTDIKMGFKIPIGKATFYPNGGSNQPGCANDFYCDQIRSLEYYAEAISRNRFASIKCKSYQDALNRSCGKNYSSVRMGFENNSAMAEGVFYVPINKNPPYGVLDDI